MGQRRSLLGIKPGEKGAVSVNIKEGGDEIEYEDQDPRIHPLWLAEMNKNGVTPRMEKFFPQGGTPGTEGAEERGGLGGSFGGLCSNATCEPLHVPSEPQSTPGSSGDGMT